MSDKKWKTEHYPTIFTYCSTQTQNRHQKMKLTVANFYFPLYCVHIFKSKMLRFILNDYLVAKSQDSQFQNQCNLLLQKLPTENTVELEIAWISCSEYYPLTEKNQGIVPPKATLELRIGNAM